MRHFRITFVLAALVLAGAARAADPPADDTHQRIERLERELRELKKDARRIEVADEERSKLRPLAGYDNRGFFIQTQDGNNRLYAGGYVHFDGRYFTNSGDTGNSTFLLRRARIDLRGKLFKYFDFKFMTDFAGGQSVIQDAWISANYFPWLRLQAGKYKAPVGLERLQSGNALMFIERALPTNLVPNRDLGFMLWGQPLYGALEYQLGIFDGVADGASLNNDIDVNDDKTFAGRFFLLPFKDRPIAFLRGFGVGLSGTYGRQGGSTSSPQTPQYRSDGQQTFFRYVTSSPATAAGTAIARGDQWRISPQGYWYWGPAGFLWEFVQSNNDIRLGNVSDTITADAWQTQLSYVLTGEKNGFRGIKPAKAFDPWKLRDGYWGAFEIAARYAQLEVERDAYTLGFANPNSAARKAKAWAVGINWYAAKQVRLMLDYNSTEFTGGAPNGGDRPDEELLMSRVQFVF